MTAGPLINRKRRSLAASEPLANPMAPSIEVAIRKMGAVTEPGTASSGADMAAARSANERRSMREDDPCVS